MKDASVAIMSKIRLLYGGEDGRDDQFISFLPLGRPLSAEDLSFADAAGGIASSSKTLHSAANFATQMNVIPASETIWSHDGRLLWDEYQSVLRQAVVADETLTAAEQEELATARDRLYDAQEGVDGESGGVVPSAMHERYREYETRFQDAKRRLNAARITTEHATDPLTEAQARAEQETLEKDVERCRAEWHANGHKETIEEAFADIERLTDGSPQIAWAEWKDQFEGAKLNDLQESRSFYPTSIWPPGFYHTDTDAGWTTVTMDGSEVDSLRDQWLADTPDGAADDMLDSAVQANIKIQSLSVELARVDLIRPWFVPAVLRSRVWQWRHDREPLSDGGDPPRGSMTAYPVSLIFARNLEIDLDATETENASVVSALQEGALQSLGPMVLGQVASTERVPTVGKLMQATFDPRETTAIAAASDPLPRKGATRRSAQFESPLVSSIAGVLTRTNTSSHGERQKNPILAKRPATHFFAGAVSPAALPTTQPAKRATAVSKKQIRPRPRSMNPRPTRSGREPRSRDHRTGTRRPPNQRDHRSRKNTVVPARRGVSTQPVTVTGTVRAETTDTERQPIEAAQVTFTLDRTGDVKTIQTDAAGAYRVQLPPGEYSATAHRYGYNDIPVTPAGGRVTVPPGPELRLDLGLSRNPSEPTDIDTWQSVQLIAVVCQKVPAAPNPDPSLTWPDGFNDGGDA